MNDQMYKQNKRVMNAEYRSRENAKTSKRERLSLSDTSASSDKLAHEEPFLKTLTRGFLQFMFSQVKVEGVICT